MNVKEFLFYSKISLVCIILSSCRLGVDVPGTPDPIVEEDPVISDDLPLDNSAPTISGSPALVAYEGIMYEFIPTSSDLDGDKLTFSINKKPDWLSFNTDTGQLSGTPTADDKGQYQDIVISVSDGDSTASLPSMELMVKTTSVTLTWVAPTVRVDGSPIDMVEIGGFKIYVGGSLNDMSLVAEINDPYTMEYVVRSLEPGTRFFAVSAYDTDGLESSFSETINIDI